MGRQIKDNFPVVEAHSHFQADFFRQTLGGGNIRNFSGKQSFKAGGSHVSAEENKKKSHLSSGKRLNRYFSRENDELVNFKEGSTVVSEQITVGHVKGQIDANGRKRKLVGGRKRKESPNVRDAKVVGENGELKGEINEVDGNEEANGTKSLGDGNKKQTKENSHIQEPPKDYIHVRASRGQATHSHSLAERVRREKISKMMKFLQDLVPGCDKFLSMKLATIYLQRMDATEALLAKDIFHFHGSMLNTYLPMDSSDSALPSEYHPQQAQLHNNISNGTDAQFRGNPLNVSALGPNPSMHSHHIDGFGESAAQVSEFWENDLHNIVHMGLAKTNLRASMLSKILRIS